MYPEKAKIYKHITEKVWNKQMKTEEKKSMHTKAQGNSYYKIGLSVSAKVLEVLHRVKRRWREKQNQFITSFPPQASL